MLARSLGIALVVSLALLRAGPAAGQMLLPNVRRLPGELGPLMAGAMTALASSGEAIWYNPAGLVHERGSALTVSGDALDWSTIAADDAASTQATMALGGLVYARALGSRRTYPHFTWGLAVAQHQQSQSTWLDGSRGGTESSLPPGLVDATAADAIGDALPDGLTVATEGEALGRLQTFAPAIGLGIATADWVRFGLALQLERVALNERLTTVTTFTDTAGGGSALAGSSQLAWVVSGEALRLGLSLGTQIDLTSGLVLGVALALPSRTVRGAGRLHFQRGDALSWDVGGGPQSASATVRASETELEFRLDTPRRLSLGLAYRSDRYLVELDLVFSSAAAPYDVLPAATASPPSTIALLLPALRTSNVPVLGMSVAMAYAATERTTLLMALADDPAPVPSDDPLFRAAGVVTLGAGLYHVRGDLSLAAGLTYRDARRTTRWAAPDGGEARDVPLSLRELTAHVAASYGY